MALSRNIVRAAVWLLFTLIGVRSRYFLLGAEFVGGTQLIVYVGGTLVLVVFGVMLTAQGPLCRRCRPKEWAIIGGVLCVAFADCSVGLTHRPTALDDSGAPSGKLGLAFLGVPRPGRSTGVLGIPEGNGIHEARVLAAVRNRLGASARRADRTPRIWRGRSERVSHDRARAAAFPHALRVPALALRRRLHRHETERDRRPDGRRTGAQRRQHQLRRLRAVQPGFRFEGQVFALLVIVLAAAEAAVALAIILNFYNNHATVDVDDADLKG